jgi:hypothetical protein
MMDLRGSKSKKEQECKTQALILFSGGQLATSSCPPKSNLGAYITQILYTSNSDVFNGWRVIVVWKCGLGTVLKM